MAFFPCRQGFPARRLTEQTSPPVKVPAVRLASMYSILYAALRKQADWNLPLAEYFDGIRAAMGHRKGYTKGNLMLVAVSCRLMKLVSAALIDILLATKCKPISDCRHLRSPVPNGQREQKTTWGGVFMARGK
eukprot:961299-Rhodomonas_salina.1